MEMPTPPKRSYSAWVASCALRQANDGNILDGNGAPRGGCAGRVFSALDEIEGPIWRFCIRRPNGLIRRIDCDGGAPIIINAAYTPAHSEESCSRLSLFEVPLLVPRPCSVRVLQQISDFEPLCMQHVRSPTALYNSERWLARAPEKQSLPTSSQVNGALSPPKTPSFINQSGRASPPVISRSSCAVEIAK